MIVIISNSIFVSQSLINHLFFLRTIREFCLSVELSFYQNNNEIIEIANGLRKRYEELEKEAISLANNKIPNQILDSGSFVTNYTLNTELLTEKLFGVMINTDLTVEEKELAGTDNLNNINIDDEIINKVSELNKYSIELTQNFIEFCKYLKTEMQNNNIFSFAYPLIYNYMLEEAGLYVSDLQRLQNRTSADPSYIINFEYYFSNSMMQAAKFIIGLSDPSQTSIIINADNYRKAYVNLMNKYQESQLSPEILKVLNEEGINLTESFRAFLIKIIERILNNNLYFIINPVFFDNLLTEANYFLYLLKGADYGIKEKDSSN